MSTCRATGSAGNPPFCKRPNRDSKARARGPATGSLNGPKEKRSLEATADQAAPVPANPAQSGAQANGGESTSREGTARQDDVVQPRGTEQYIRNASPLPQPKPQPLQGSQQVPGPQPFGEPQAPAWPESFCKPR
ncbi:hypothetical protein HPB50_018551 [Hyalomma asiaticum]|uniref:Uncharacterized protein n=1 Tax=Hyalomma asiaticum TaxID=266040 RepID=A0ACB7TME3_HYAAI|nr:hypothetical protein HPB50_018551 [Hyalomma asiaticum]